MVGAVKINEPVEGVDSGSDVNAFFQSSEAENAGRDERLLVRATIGSIKPAFPRELTAYKDGSLR
jgi:hypothetical protein